MKNILVLTPLIFLISCGNSQKNSTSNTNSSDAENVYIYDQETNKKLKQAEDLINNDQYNKAFQILLELAKQGNPVAQNDVGIGYQYGFNEITNEKKAIEWYTLAANQKYAPALHNLGLLEFNKAKNDSDYKKALDFFLKAEKQNHYESISIIGIFYKNGIIYPKNLTKSIEKFKISAEHGNASGQFNLAQAYYYGEGVQQDLKKALEWYKKSSEQNYEAASIQLANLYANGKGTSKDLGKAINLLKPIAEDGNATAQYNLAIAYREQKNEKEFLLWKGKYEHNPNKTE